jgi:hypothetical protein
VFRDAVRRTLIELAGRVVAVAASDGTITPAPLAADPRDPARLKARHGWPGAHQRPAGATPQASSAWASASTHPGLGRFLSVDPVTLLGGALAFRFSRAFTVTYDAHDHATAVDDGVLLTTETLSPSGRVIERKVHVESDRPAARPCPLRL